MASDLVVVVVVVLLEIAILSAGYGAPKKTDSQQYSVGTKEDDRVCVVVG
jgi:hypothetical protein